MFGRLIVTNTIEEFANKDKKQMITDLGKEVRMMNDHSIMITLLLFRYGKT